MVTPNRLAKLSVDERSQRNSFQTNTCCLFLHAGKWNERRKNGLSACIVYTSSISRDVALADVTTAKHCSILCIHHACM